MAHAQITPEIRSVFERSTVDGNVLKLPDEQLPRDLYGKVAKALELSGGKWNRSKQGFLFASDPRPALGLALQTGVVKDKKKTRQAFYTPDEVAAEVVLLADVSGRTVLEPSAGDGSLVKQCLFYGAESVHCVELEPSCKDSLLRLSKPKQRVTVDIGDFMEFQSSIRYARVVMNPPFTKGQYHKHIRKALSFLNPGGYLFAIVPDNGCKYIEEMGAETLRRFTNKEFKESGTDVSTRLIRLPALPVESPVKKAARKRAAAVGFTLLELLVVVAIVAIIAAAAASFLVGRP